MLVTCGEKNAYVSPLCSNLEMPTGDAQLFPNFAETFAVQGLCQDKAKLSQS
jgi:hypothetical protein